MVEGLTCFRVDIRQEQKSTAVPAAVGFLFYGVRSLCFCVVVTLDNNIWNRQFLKIIVLRMFAMEPTAAVGSRNAFAHLLSAEKTLKLFNAVAERIRLVNPVWDPSSRTDRFAELTFNLVPNLLHIIPDGA